MKMNAEIKKCSNEQMLNDERCEYCKYVQSINDDTTYICHKNNQIQVSEYDTCKDFVAGSPPLPSGDES